MGIIQPLTKLTAIDRQWEKCSNQSKVAMGQWQQQKTKANRRSIIYEPLPGTIEISEEIVAKSSKANCRTAAIDTTSSIAAKLA